MRKVFDIIKKLKRSINMLLLLGCVLMLSSCGDGCPTVAEYLQEGTGEANCFFCVFFKVITSAATSAANKSWSTFAKDLSEVVMIGTVLYVAFFTLKGVGSFGSLNLGTYLSDDKKGIIPLCFKMAVICALLLDTEQFFIKNILIPMFMAGLEIGGELASGSSNFTINTSAVSNVSGGWGSFFEVINNIVLAVNDAIYFVVALGKAITCFASTGFFIIEWDLLMMIYGTFLYVYGWFLLVAISFYIVDILLTLTFGAVLLPFGIACFVSDKTKSYSKQIWQLFLSSFFSFIMLGVIIGLAVQIIEVGMGKTSDGNSAVNSFLTDFNKRFNEDDIETLGNELMQTGGFFLTFVGLMMVGALVEQVDTLVQKISGGAGAASSAGQTIGQAATKASIKTAKHVGGYAGDAVKAGTKQAWNSQNSKRIRSRLAMHVKNKTGLDLTKLNTTSVAERFRRFQGKMFGIGKYGHEYWGRKILDD